MPILPSVILHINRVVTFTFTLLLTQIFTHKFSAYSLHLLHCVLRLLHLFFRLSPQTNLKPSQQWPAHMKQTQLQRKSPHLSSRNPNLANLGISTLGNLGNLMNTMKTAMKAKNILGRHKGRMNKSRNSLDILGECKNSQSRLSMNKHKSRGKGRRRFSSLKSLLPKDRGLRRMTLRFTEMGLWRSSPPSLRQSNPTSTMGCSSIWPRLMN